MTQFIYGLLCGTLLGACCALIYAMLRTPRKPRGITKHARRQHEFVHRRWRDLEVEIVPPREGEVGGIDYRFINITGLEDK